MISNWFWHLSRQRLLCSAIQHSTNSPVIAELWRFAQCRMEKPETHVLVFNTHTRALCLIIFLLLFSFSIYWHMFRCRCRRLALDIDRYLCTSQFSQVSRIAWSSLLYTDIISYTIFFSLLIYPLERARVHMRATAGREKNNDLIHIYRFHFVYFLPFDDSNYVNILES